MILCDKEIRTLAEAGMIDPFEPAQVREGMISYGLSSFGYDLRLSDNELDVFHPMEASIIDPKRFDPFALSAQTMHCSEGQGKFQEAWFILPPFGSALGRSMEVLTLPEDVFAICMGKSTYARCGLIVNTTPLEPGWTGHLVIELHNTTPLPIKVYASEGIAQLIFFRGNRPEVTYADRKGKYQGQTGITTARI